MAGIREDEKNRGIKGRKGKGKERKEESWKEDEQDGREEGKQNITGKRRKGMNSCRNN